MERLITKLNDLDITNMVQRYGIGFGYEKREGSNGGMMLDGSETVDVLAWKSVLTIPMNPMTKDEQSAVLQEVMSDYVTVYYYEPKIAGYKSASFIPTVGASSAAILRVDGAYWFQGLALTLRER